MSKSCLTIFTSSNHVRNCHPRSKSLFELLVGVSLSIALGDPQRMDLLAVSRPKNRPTLRSLLFYLVHLQDTLSSLSVEGLQPFE
jgi:hypothetical protein